MDTLLQDIRYGLRMLVKRPGFSAIAIFALALGIGANSTIFNLVNAVLLRPLPIENPDEMVAIYTSDYSGPLYGTSSFPDYLDFRDKADAFSGLIAYMISPLSMSVGGNSERVFSEIVSGNYFDVLGQKPSRGRGFLPEEDRVPGQHAVAVVSQEFWKTRFGGDPTILGKEIDLNGHPFTIVGVAGEGFSGLNRGLAVDIWVPIMMQAQALPGDNDLSSRGDRSLSIMGRLKPGATIEQARAQLQVIAEQLHDAYPANWTDVRKAPRAVTVVPENEARVLPSLRGDVLGFMGLLMCVAGLVLLVACANVANLLLARATARRREIAVRLALGASRLRLVRQLITESVLLALFGGGAGLLLALWGTELLRGFKPPVPVPVALDFSMDYRVLGFTLVISVFTGVIFGIVPALQASRPNLVTALREESGASGGGSRISRLRGMFVVAQVALSLLLLVGSGLFLRSLQKASLIDLGFDPSNVLVMSIDLQLQGYDQAQGLAFYRQLLDRVRVLPGVEAVSLVEELPLGLGGSRRGIGIEGYTPDEQEDMEVHSTLVGPDYFRAMRIPLQQGRAFDDRDHLGSPVVVIVNEAFARRYWPGQNPLGKHITRGRRDGQGEDNFEVIGVARDGKYVTLGEEPTPFFYFSILQSYRGSATLIARTTGNPLDQLPTVRSEIQSLDRYLPVYDVKTLASHLTLALLPARLASVILGIFGLIALVLASVGIYGMMSYSVVLRTREIGIRLALGAESRNVVKLIVWQGMRLALVGVTIGLAGALVLTRFLSSLLYGVSAVDPLTFSAITLLLTGVALVACYVPARRATRIDPMVALRYE